MKRWEIWNPSDDSIDIKLNNYKNGNGNQMIYIRTVDDEIVPLGHVRYDGEGMYPRILSDNIIICTTISKKKAMDILDRLWYAIAAGEKFIDLNEL